MQLIVQDMQVDISTVDCEFPEDERARIQPWLEDLAFESAEFPDTRLAIKVIFHPQRGIFNAEFALKVPGRTLKTRTRDLYLDSALERGYSRLKQLLGEYKQNLDSKAVEEARRREARESTLIAPDIEESPLVKAVEEGDYRAFRLALDGYEDWLNKRVGRWIQRRPEYEAHVGTVFLVSEVVEEVYLNAFANFHRRREDVRLSEWLEELIEPSIRELLRETDEALLEVSLAKTLCKAESPGAPEVSQSAGDGQERPHVVS